MLIGNLLMMSNARTVSRGAAFLVAMHTLAACDPGGEPQLDSSGGSSTIGSASSASGDDGSGSAEPTVPPDASGSGSGGLDVQTTTAGADGSTSSGGPSSTSSPETSGGDDRDFECTQVIGYSQVRQWYNAGFEDLVDDDRWQLLWNGGAAVQRWAQADYEGWNNDIVSPCARRSAEPDRIILSVSGAFGDDEPAWAEAIEAAIGTIRDKHPTVSSIVLQPVVGGPDHETCNYDGQPVRASWQHMHIDEAIAAVLSDGVTAGVSPEVESCDQYRDATGHLEASGSSYAAQRIGEYYAP